MSLLPAIFLKLQNEILYKYAKQALTFLKTGEKKVIEYENLNFGEVVVGVSDTLCKYYLTPYLDKFNKKYPNIKIRIKCHNTPETVQLLKSNYTSCKRRQFKAIY